MSDPRISPLPPDLDRLLAVEREAQGPSPEARARLAARLSATLGVPLGVGLGGPGPVGTAPAAGAPAGGLVAGAKLLAIVVVGSVAVGGGTYLAGRALVRGRGQPAGVMAPAEAPPPSAPDRRAPARAPDRAAAPPPVASPVAPPPTRRGPGGGAPRTRDAPAIAPGGSSLAAEGALLNRARTDLARGDAAAALAALATHRARYPHGPLAEEAGALRVLALCRLGRPRAARGAAARFYARWPGSLLRGAVDQALQGLPQAP